MLLLNISLIYVSNIVVNSQHRSRENSMYDFKKRTEEILDELKTERDELRVRLHLAKLESSEEWQKLEHQMVKCAEAHAPDVHARSLTNGFQALEHLNGFGGVLAIGDRGLGFGRCIVAG